MRMRQTFITFILLIFSAFLFADPPFLLKNTILAGLEKSAVLECNESEKRYMVTVEDSIDKYTVESIEPHRIKLSKSTGSLTLYLHSRNRSVDRQDGESDGNKAENITFEWPSEETAITSGFGYRQHPMGGGEIFHKGIDLALTMNTPVYASTGGEVTFAGKRSTYGELLIIKHPADYETRYAHLDEIKVEEGDLVSVGEKVAYSGNTGRSTGPHLHFEIRKEGVPVDPTKYLPEPE